MNRIKKYFAVSVAPRQSSSGFSSSSLFTFFFCCLSFPFPSVPSLVPSENRSPVLPDLRSISALAFIGDTRLSSRGWLFVAPAQDEEIS